MVTEGTTPHNPQISLNNELPHVQEQAKVEEDVIEGRNYKQNSVKDDADPLFKASSPKADVAKVSSPISATDTPISPRLTYLVTSLMNATLLKKTPEAPSPDVPNHPLSRRGSEGPDSAIGSSEGTPIATGTPIESPGTPTTTPQASSSSLTKTAQIFKATINGEEVLLEKMSQLGKGLSGVVYQVKLVEGQTISDNLKKILDNIGHEFALKVVILPSKKELAAVQSDPEKLDQLKASVQKRNESFYNADAIARDIRPLDQPNLKIKGIQDRPFLVTVTSIEGGQEIVKVAQFGKEYLGDMAFLRKLAIPDPVTEPKEHHEWMSYILPLFDNVVDGHIYLQDHGYAQLDNTLNNYFMEKKDEVREACIADLDSCYRLKPDLNTGKLKEGATFPSGQMHYQDVTDYFALVKFYNESPSDATMTQIKELAEKMTVFSTGCLLYELTVGDIPFHIPADDLEEKITDRQDPRVYPTVTESPLEPCDPFIAKMLKADPQDRPTLAEVKDFLQTQLKELAANPPPQQHSGYSSETEHEPQPPRP